MSQLTEDEIARLWGGVRERANSTYKSLVLFARAIEAELATRCRAAGGMHETAEPETSLDKLAPPAKEKA